MIRWLGACCIIAACGGFGFLHASRYKREEIILQQLIHILDYMECELQYRLTPLPQLCRQAAGETKGVLNKLFFQLALELENQISPDVSRCMAAALQRTDNIPNKTVVAMEELGRYLGRFDLDGQVKGLQAVKQICRTQMDQLVLNRDMNTRGYQTLGLCAGAALVILFI